MELAIKNDFKIKFDGQQHQVDANVLISSLVHTTTIVQEVNRYLNAGKKIEIKVKALEKGSFLIHIELIETAFESLKNLLTKENVVVAKEIITALIELIQIKKILKGKNPKSIEKEQERTKIENHNGDVIYIENYTYNIYNNNTIVKDALSQNFDALNNDPAITGFEITDENEVPYIRIEKEEFEDLALKSEDIKEGERRITEAATLNIVRVSFEANLKWDFYYKGNKISAKIADPTFYEIIDKGQAFAKGDVLKVELQINQQFDESVNTYVIKSYQINKIHQHDLRNKPPQINFEKE